MKHLLIILLSVTMLIGCGVETSDEEIAGLDQAIAEAKEAKLAEEQDAKDKEAQDEQEKRFEELEDVVIESLASKLAKGSPEVDEGEQAEHSKEGVANETNIDLDAFIKSYNSIADNAGAETFENNGSAILGADGLIVSVNKNGTVWGMLQPAGSTPLSVIATLKAIGEQANEEDFEKIEILLEDFTNALNDGVTLVEEIYIDSMTINLTVVSADSILFHILGDEQP